MRARNFFLQQLKFARSAKKNLSCRRKYARSANFFKISAGVVMAVVDVTALVVKIPQAAVKAKLKL